MIRIIKEKKDYKDRPIKMSELKPLQAGIVLGEGSSQDGHLVMRTACYMDFEVMDLTEPYPDSCWDLQRAREYTVRLLKPGETYLLEISGGPSTSSGGEND